MMALSNPEYYEMMLCVGATDGNLSAARDLYRQRFIDGRPAAEARQLPSLRCLRDASDQLREPRHGKQPGISARRCSGALCT